MEHQYSSDEARAETAQKKDYLLPASILISGILISASIFYVMGKPQGPANPELANIGQPSVPEVSSRDVILGDPKAPVTLIEYGDYQCPFCEKFFKETELQIREEYVKTGKVRMVFRNFPFLSEESFASAEAAHCAADQGKFWLYHDALYTEEGKDAQEHNGNLNRDLFMKIAGDLKMDTKAFASCYDGKKYAAAVDEDVQNAQMAAVDSTPTSFINGTRIKGAVPYAQVKQVIEGFLKK